MHSNRETLFLSSSGHNDAGEINTGKARAELPGSGEESKVFLMEKTGKYQVILYFRLVSQEVYHGRSGKGCDTYRFKPYPTQ